MSNKERMSELTKLLLKNQILEHFNITNPISTDFVKDYVDVDLYVDSDDEGATYITIGMSRTAVYGELLWVEFCVPTSSRLKHELEVLMIREIANIICWIHKNDIELENGTIYTPSQEAREAFGFDYLMLDAIDLEVTHPVFDAEPIYFVVPVPIYKNEYEYYIREGYENFRHEYEEQVPEDRKLNFDFGRPPINV